MLTVGAHEHEHPQIPIFCHERLKSRFFATECSWWALMAKYQDFRVLMLMGAHREHPEIPIELSLSFTNYHASDGRSLVLIRRSLVPK